MVTLAPISQFRADGDARTDHRARSPILCRRRFPQARPDRHTSAPVPHRARRSGPIGRNGIRLAASAAGNVIGIKQCGNARRKLCANRRRFQAPGSCPGRRGGQLGGFLRRTLRHQANTGTAERRKAVTQVRACRNEECQMPSPPRPPDRPGHRISARCVRRHRRERAIPAFSQICASVEGPKILKKPGIGHEGSLSAVFAPLLLRCGRRGRRRRVEIHLVATAASGSAG